MLLMFEGHARSKVLDLLHFHSRSIFISVWFYLLLQNCFKAVVVAADVDLMTVSVGVVVVGVRA